MKKFLNLLLLMLVCVMLSGCGTHRDYIWSGMNQSFAKKLEKCKRYTTPVYYRTTILPIPVDKSQLKILGIKNNACIIRANENEDPFKPFGRGYGFSLHPDVAKELSEMLQVAYKESYYEEQEASELARQFSQKYDIWCASNDFRERTRCIRAALDTPMFSSKNYDKVKMLTHIRDKRKAQCDARIQTILKRIESTPNYSALSSVQKYKLVCNGMNTDGYKCSIHYNYGKTEKIGSLHKRTDEFQCLLEFDEYGYVRTNHFYHKSINDILKETK